MKKNVTRMVALIMTFLMLLGTSLSAFGDVRDSQPIREYYGWVMETETGKWYYINRDGFPVCNGVKKSGDFWFWLDADGTLIVGQEGLKIEPIKGITFYLNDDGSLKPIGTDSAGKEYNMDEIYTGEQESGYPRWKTVKKTATSESIGWQYFIEKGKPIEKGVHEIDGYFYYFNEDGIIPWDNRGKIVDGYYINSADDAIAVNRWIFTTGKWYYFDSDGKKMTGAQVIDDITYDLGTDGGLSEGDVDFGRVKSITLDTQQKSALVGDIVEIPFEIEMEPERVWVASGSNAVASNSNVYNGYWEEREVPTDYSLFKTAFEVNHVYRVNIGNFNTEYVEGNSNLQYAVETKYDIDWDNQVIKIPVKLMGAIFGKLRIGNIKSNSFEMVCKYGEDISVNQQIEDIFNFEKTEQKLEGLKNIGSEKLATAMFEDENIRQQMWILETAYKGQKDIEISNDLSAELKTIIDEKKINIMGLAFSTSADTGNKNIKFMIKSSSEQIPSDIFDSYKTVSLDLTASGGGIESNNLDIPVSIQMPVPKGLTSDDLHLYHIHNGEVEELSVTIEDNVVHFVTGGFSTFIFAQEKTGNNSGGGSSSDGGGGGGSPSGNKSVAKADPLETPGAWSQNELGWTFARLDGQLSASQWLMNGGNWFKFDEKGYMMTGWFTDVDGKKFYLNPVSDGTMGAMKTGWQTIDGKWYYFNLASDGTKGVLLVNTTTPDGFIVNVDGVWVQ